MFRRLTVSKLLLCGGQVLSDSLRPHTTVCSLPGSSVHGISQARILDWVAIPPPGIFDPGIELMSPTLAGGFFTTEPLGKPLFLNNYANELETSEHI